MPKPKYATAFLLAAISLLLVGLCGCQTAGGLVTQPETPMAFGAFPLCESSLFFTLQEEAEETEAAEEEDEEQSTLATVLLYIPNRIFDLFDMVRAGVNVGPGLGLDVRATKYAKVQLISDTSVGVGFQSLRHLPVCARSQMKLGLAFISTPSMDILNWYYGDYDLRVELYLLLVGAHVAVDMGEIVDFVGGLFLWDPMEDDFQVD